MKTHTVIKSLFFSLLLSVIASYPALSFADDVKPTPGEQIHVMIEPVIGYQSLKRNYPYDHTQGMLTYGGRVVVGTYELAGELEVQYGSASETFPTANPPVNVDSSFLQARLGARKVIPIIEEFHLLGRAGLQGSHFSNDITIAGKTTTDSPSWQYRPYFGAGVILYLFKSLSLSIEEVYVVDTSWETGFGFRLFI